MYIIYTGPQLQCLQHIHVYNKLFFKFVCLGYGDQGYGGGPMRGSGGYGQRGSGGGPYGQGTYLIDKLLLFLKWCRFY